MTGDVYDSIITVAEDKVGQPVHIGSRVAVAFRRGDVAELRLGKVVGVSSQKDYYWEKKTPDGKRPQLVIEWETDGARWAVQKSKIFPDLKRFVVLEKFSA